MIGHEALIVMRRKGRTPAGGVVVDYGFLDPFEAHFWHRPNRYEGWAVVHANEGEPVTESATYWAASLRVVVRVGSEVAKASLRRLLDGLQAHKPKTLQVILLDPMRVPAQCWDCTGSTWRRIELAEVGSCN